MFFQFIREITGGIFNSFFITCSFFGETGTAIILIALLYWCINKKLGEYLFISLGWADLVNSFAKITACIYRPWVLDSRVKPLEDVLDSATGYSFPSGHATTSTALFGGTVLGGKFSKPLNIVLIIFLCLVCFCRLYVGVHSVLDVVCGFIFTLIVLIVIRKLFEKVEEKPNLDIIICVIGIIAAVILMVYSLTKSYPMDYDAAGKLLVDPAKLMLDGFGNAGLAVAAFIAWPIERRFIKFVTDGDFETKLLRGICGFLCLELITNVIVPLLGNDTVGRFSGNFIIVIFVMLIYPAIIKYFQNRKSSAN